MSCGCNDQLAAHGGAGAEVELSSGEVLRCRAVVGADGTKSRIAAGLGLKRASYAGEVYFRWCPPIHRCSSLLLPSCALPASSGLLSPSPPNLACHAQNGASLNVPSCLLGQLASYSAGRPLVHLIDGAVCSSLQHSELAAWPADFVVEVDMR